MATDPRTSVREALHAIHIAELTDNDGWSMLIAMAEEQGLDELARRFQGALNTEAVHLAQVRTWLLAMAGSEGPMPSPDVAP